MNKITNGVLFVISGPSGSGKSTLCQDILKNEKLSFGLSVSHTTREKRAQEVDGVHYTFLSKEQFEENIKNGFYLEYANVHGNYYGTPNSEVNKILNSGKHVILEIDVQGGLQIKKTRPEASLIFISPPNYSVLEKRLRGRGTESHEVIDTRLKNAILEMQEIKQYDYLIINEDYKTALSELEIILKAEQKRINHLQLTTFYATLRDS